MTCITKNIFQFSYVTNRMEEAIDLAASTFGVGDFHTFEAETPVISRGEAQSLALRVAVANSGLHQFEIIEPVSGPTWIYTEGKDLVRQPLVFHHVGIAVLGPYTSWLDTIAELRAGDDEIVQICQPSADEEPFACFAYVDNRKTLGHHTEYLWWSKTMNGMPTMPAIRQE